ncbi:MAG: tyrosine-protein phosphatase [Thermoleophilia bacterium]|nr:tyrosine-protein phosphatase [Thermoleophilia bacterium]
MCLPGVAVGPLERTLAWDGCCNVRDLGGIETSTGRRTRHGAVVRADNIRRLSAAGWHAALAHGIRRVIDLRFDGEEPGEPDAPAEVEVIGVSLFGRHSVDAAKVFDDRLLAADDVGSVFAAGYIHTLKRSPERVAQAVAAVADADHDHGVLVHCFAGKDRTGIISALLLSVAGVPDEAIAADYAASEANMPSLFDDWIATAADADARTTRQRSALSPTATMEGVLAWLQESSGGAHDYLRAGGLTSDQIHRLERRLVET